jgi:hypothetical protein
MEMRRRVRTTGLPNGKTEQKIWVEEQATPISESNLIVRVITMTLVEWGFFLDDDPNAAICLRH